MKEHPFTRFAYDQWYRCYFIRKERKRATFWFEQMTCKKYDRNHEKQIVFLIKLWSLANEFK
jgi:hypothetical protein